MDFGSFVFGNPSGGIDEHGRTLSDAVFQRWKSIRTAQQAERRETVRHWWIYFILYALVGVFGLSPFAGTDIASLSPAEAVWLEESDGYVHIETDSEETGIGKTLLEALENMKQTASGVVFLDTADYVIVKQGSEALLSQAADVLRPSCSVCVADSMPDLAEAAEYLGVHEPAVKLKNIATAELPYLTECEGRMTLIEKEYTDTAADGMADRRN